MKLKYLSFFALLLYVVACEPKAPSAEDIVNKAIEAHGGELFENSKIDFDFRGRHYTLERNQGKYSYHRIFSDSLGAFHDILSNDGFTRTLNDTLVDLDAEWIRRYSNSVNSVAYFALLPFGLNDAAVNKKIIGEEEINGNYYYKIRVTFSQDGGGEDYEDEFVFWFHKDTFQMDYFGYYYLTDGGGIRFREAFNTRKSAGLIFSDYVNYQGIEGSNDVEGLALKFKKGELQKLSKIVIENLEVLRIVDS